MPGDYLLGQLFTRELAPQRPDLHAAIVMDATDKNPHPAANLWMATPFISVGLGWVILENGWVSVMLFHGLMLLALFCHRSHWDFARVIRGGRLWWLIPVSILMALFTLVLFDQRDRYEATLANKAAAFGLDGPSIPALAAYFCIFNPVFEELFWRGLFGSNHVRPTLSDLCYGSFHFLIVLPFVKVSEALVVAGFLVLVGYLWRQITFRSGGQRLPIIWHALGDIAVIGTFAFVASRN